MKSGGNLILDESFSFALQIVELYRKLVKQNEFVISKQILRSGTSIGANVEEGVVAQSRKDFINKLSIALKEAHETRYWLRLLKISELIKSDAVDELIKNIESIVRILSKIIKTSRTNN